MPLSYFSLFLLSSASGRIQRRHDRRTGEIQREDQSQAPGMAGKPAAQLPFSFPCSPHRALLTLAVLTIVTLSFIFIRSHRPPPNYRADVSTSVPPQVMEHMAWVWIAITVILIWAISLCRVIFSSQLWPSKVPIFSHETGQGTKRKNVLLVIAHPDDESMFFSPTILFLVSEGHNLHILCMSTGNAEGKGNIRKEELYRACTILRVPLQQIKILDHPKLQDGFNEPWDHDLLATIISEEIKVRQIDMIITFDRYGISGHPNHRDVHYGLCMCLQRGKQHKPEAWELISRSILHKYSGPLDAWLSICSSFLDSQGRTCCVLNTYPYKGYLAMAEHESQWIWFRKLFVLFSSYTYANTLKKINI